MDITSRFIYLLDKYLNNTIRPAENAELFRLLATGNFDALVQARLENAFLQIDAADAEPLSRKAERAILYNILHAKGSLPPEHAGKKRRFREWPFAAAATIVFIITLTVYFHKGDQGPDSFTSRFMHNNSRRSVNRTGSPLAVLLADGSRVTLQPGSALYYSSGSFAAKREVYMEGEALFNIAKDPLKPFYVYYRNVITKVLGTSFTIRTSRLSGNVEVSVLTGKVQVYENEKILRDARINNGVIVTPNQKAVYQGKKRLFAATLVEQPVPIGLDKNTDDPHGRAGEPIFDFDEAKLSVVLKAIETNYGITVQVSNENLYNCRFSGDVSNHTLFDMLRIICIATNSSYEIDGAHILIKGKGCD